MKYFQQRISEHIDAYWAISYTGPMPAVCYHVNDETGEVIAFTEIKIKSIQNVARNGENPQVMLETLQHNVRRNVLVDHAHVVFPISEITFLVAIGAVWNTTHIQ